MWEGQQALSEPEPPKNAIERHATTIVEQIKTLGKAAKSLTAIELLLIVGACVLAVGGMSAQIITLNLWLYNFGPYADPFTVLTLTGSMMGLIFICAAVGRVIFLRKRFKFIFTRAAFLQNLLIGFCNAANGVMIVYATQPTPEILQALLTSTQIFWTLLFAKFMLRDDRNYMSPLIFISFILCVAGIILPMVPMFKSEHMTASTRYWTLIFAGAMIPASVYNIVASNFMRRFTDPNACVVSSPAVSPDVASRKRNFPVDSAALGDKVTSIYAADTPVQEEDPNTSDDTTVKLLMLGISGVWQVAWFMILLPMDAVPWFGSSPNVHTAAEHLSTGYKCVFNVDNMCPTNFKFFIFFNLAYMCQYIGGAYLNHYSAGLFVMISQLSAPLASIILMAHPAWNVNKGDYTVATCIGGIILLTIGSLLYSSWEEGTRDRSGGAGSDAGGSPAGGNETDPLVQHA